MAKTEFTYCRGQQCPSRNQCKRYAEGLRASNDAKFIQSCRHAKLFINKDLRQ